MLPLLLSCAPEVPAAPDPMVAPVPTPTTVAPAPVPTAPPTTPPLACVPGPVSPLPMWPLASTEGPGTAAVLGAPLEVLGDAAPGAVLDVLWPAPDGTSVQWYVGGALSEDCAALPGDACLWVDGALVDTTVAAGGFAAVSITANPGLQAGEAVVVQASGSDGLVSAVWAGVYDAASVGSDPFTSLGWWSDELPKRLFPGTYRGLFLREVAVEAVLRMDAGETVSARATFSPPVPFGDCPVDLSVWGYEIDDDVIDIGNWEDPVQTALMTSSVSQWVGVSTGTGLYEPMDSPFDLVIEVIPSVSEHTWYADLDADGYGDENLPMIAAIRPAFASEVAGDCDDGAADVHPGGLETCDDGRDADCDGRDDCATVLDGPGPAAIAVIPTQETWAWLAPVGDLTGDGVPDLASGDGVLAGPFAGDRSTEDLVVRFSFYPVGAGDLDGDGAADVFASYGEAVQVLLGPFAGQYDASCGVFLSSAVADGPSFTPRPAADTDGDGLSEILVLGGLDDAGERAPGATLYRGPFDTSRTDLDADARIQLGPAGTARDDTIESATADLDGDGLSEILLYDAIGDGLTVVWGPPPAFLLVESPDRPIPADADPGLALGDFDGDGGMDIAFTADSAGVAAVEIVAEVYAAPFATLRPATDLLDPPAEWNLAAAGDIDGDGVDDLLLSPADWSQDALWLAGPLWGVVEPETVGTSYAGTPLLFAAGDLDRDGYDDLIASGLSEPGEEPVRWPGYVLFGR